ncbi:MAG: peptidoglycan DD-metalloendopeptidase family protein [Clostridia bacterium]|nr:peptidoglycan DD-metalloendopeptidase family protein [Clostridia bacterium]
MKHYNAKKIIAAVMSVVVIASSFVWNGFNSYAKTVGEYQNELDDIQARIDENEKKLSQISEDKKKQQETLDLLQQQLENTQSQINTIEKQINSLNIEIAEVEKSITTLNSQINDLADSITETQNNIIIINNKIDETYDTLAKRLRASYLSGEDSNLKILMGSESIASFLTRLEMMKRVSENDTKMIDEFKENVTQLKKAQSKLETQKQELESKRGELSEKKASLKEKKAEFTEKEQELQSTVADKEKRYQEVESYVQKLDKDTSTYKDYIQKLENDAAYAESQMNSIIAERTTTRPTTQSTTLGSENNDTPVTVAPNVNGESFMFPLPRNIGVYISSGYGGRIHPIYGYYKEHGGVDLTAGGIYGKAIYASRSGTVIGAIWDAPSYGNYVIIDHGDGFVTLYAHCSNLCCSTGDYVVQGQKIAEVGSTGDSNGPHLHFEVRYNGERTNPMNYISIP